MPAWFLPVAAAQSGSASLFFQSGPVHESYRSAGDPNDRPVVACVWRELGETEAQAISRTFSKYPEAQQARQIVVFSWLPPTRTSPTRQ
jgi:hypothetical protein